MRSLNAFLSLSLILAVVLFGVQTASLSHAAQYGDYPHEHDGVTCELQALATVKIAVLPVAPSVAAFPLNVLRFPASVMPALIWQWPPERAPPPRGPPVFQQ